MICRLSYFGDLHYTDGGYSGSDSKYGKGSKSKHGKGSSESGSRSGPEGIIPIFLSRVF